MARDSGATGSGDKDPVQQRDPQDALIAAILRSSRETPSEGPPSGSEFARQFGPLPEGGIHIYREGPWASPFEQNVTPLEPGKAQDLGDVGLDL